jgi:tRNA (adenine57-N1/adenine58-N1)-methyltransferase
MEGRKPGGPLREGEEVILVDPKGEEHMITLSPGKPFGTHKGNILHEDIIGKPDGSRVWTAMGTQYQVFRPTFNQYVMNLKRHAQIIYPLAIKLLEAVGPSGRLASYEVREDFAASGARTVKRFLGACANHEIKVRDIYRGIEEREVDRIVLDLPEPWHVVPHAAQALVPGGILLSYLPSTIQVKQMVDRVEEEGGFTPAEVFEVIHRPWHVKGQSVRPVQWMFSHSAFLIVCRKLSSEQGRS